MAPKCTAQLLSFPHCSVPNLSGDSNGWWDYHRRSDDNDNDDVGGDGDDDYGDGKLGDGEYGYGEYGGADDDSDGIFVDDDELLRKTRSEVLSQIDN